MREHDQSPLSKTLYVTGFPDHTRAKELAVHFQGVGEIHRCDIPAVYGRKAYAFVEYKDMKDAKTAIETLNKQPIDDGILHIEYAKRAARPEWDSQSREPRRYPRDYKERRSPREYGKYGRYDERRDYERRDYDRRDYERPRDYDRRPRYYDDRERDRSPRRYRRSPPPPRGGRDASPGGRSPANGSRYGRRYSRSASPSRDRDNSNEPSKRAPPKEPISGEGRRSASPPRPAPAPQQDDLDVAE